MKEKIKLIEEFLMENFPHLFRLVTTDDIETWIKGKEMEKVTEKESKILKAIEDSEFSMEGNGLCGYIDEDEFDIKIYRGVLSSLIKKKIIGVEDMDGETWVWINSEFVLEVNDKNNDNGYVFNPHKIQLH